MRAMGSADMSQQIEKTLDAIQRRVDGLDLEDLEIDSGPGRLDIACPDGARVILSRQAATNQIWLAEPGGGWHFDLRDGRWLCDKRGVELHANLSALLSAHCGTPISLG
jgi:CyaY protein